MLKKKIKIVTRREDLHARYLLAKTVLFLQMFDYTEFDKTRATSL